MLKGGERYTLTTSKSSVIREALSLVFTGVNSDEYSAPSTLERLKEFARAKCDALILDLRTAKERGDDISPTVRNLGVNHIGQVLLVTGESNSPQVLHRREELYCPRFFPKHVMFSLSVLVHMFFWVIRRDGPQG